MDALLYILRTGCQWRNLPSCFPHWQAVYWYFSQWKRQNIIEQINRALNQMDRINVDRDKNPSILCIDSQSVKLSPMICELRGTDANKKVNGRKRQVLVDSEGRIWFAHIHAANQADGPASLAFMADLTCQDERLVKIYGDQAYNGVFADEIRKIGVDFEKASKPESTSGFIPVAKRWVVERTFAWTNFFRRIVKDYEYTVSSSVSWLFLANIQLMLQRIKPISKT
jgi:transposase